MQISFVGFQPVQSSEHLAAMGMFGFIQLYAAVVWVKSKLSMEHFRVFMRTALVCVASIVSVALFIAYMTGCTILFL